MEVCLETGRVGCAELGAGGVAVRSVVGGSLVGGGTSDIENMKNFLKFGNLDFPDFLWVESLMKIFGRARRRRDVDGGKRVEPQYNSPTNHTINNCFIL